MPKQETFEEVLARLQKTYPNSVKRGSDVAPVQFHPTGIRAVDAVCGGGLPVGRIIELYGPERVGKSTLALTIAQSYASILWIDADNKYDGEYARQLGVDIEKFVVLSKLTLAQTMQAIRDNLHLFELVVIDSLPSLTPQKELDNKDLDTVAAVAPLAAMLNRVLPIFAARAAKAKTTLFLINQVRDKLNLTNKYQNPWNQPGGHQLKSLGSLRLVLMERDKLKDAKLGIYGVNLALVVEKSSVGASWQRSELAFINRVGMIEPQEVLEFRNVLLKEAGARQVTLEKPLMIEASGEEILDLEEGEGTDA